MGVRTLQMERTERVREVMTRMALSTNLLPAMPACRDSILEAVTNRAGQGSNDTHRTKHEYAARPAGKNFATGLAFLLILR